MPYSVEFTKSAAKEFRKLPTNVQQRLASAIDDLHHQPRPPGCKTLQGTNGIVRIRVADFRVLYRVRDDVDRPQVLVVKVGARRDVYRYLKVL